MGSAETSPFYIPFRALTHRVREMLVLRVSFSILEQSTRLAGRLHVRCALLCICVQDVSNLLVAGKTMVRIV